MEFLWVCRLKYIFSKKLRDVYCIIYRMTIPFVWKNVGSSKITSDFLLQILSANQNYRIYFLKNVSYKF